MASKRNRFRFRMWDVAAVLVALALPLNVYFLFGLFPATRLEGVGGCRQISVHPVDFSDSQTCVCIIGASHGIGRDMARKLSKQHGVKLIVTGRSKERIQVAAKSFPRQPILSAAFDLEDDDSIMPFTEQLRTIVRESCNGKLDYLLLNGAQIYADGYDGKFVTRGGRYDRLFGSNFIGYVHLLKAMQEEIRAQNTRVVFVASVAHYTGRVDDILTPNTKDKDSVLEQMLAYHTSKMAFVSMQHVLAKASAIPNSVAVTCGSVKTSIDVKDAERDKETQQTSSFIPSIFRNTFQFTSEEGADIVLDAAFLPSNVDVTPGEFVLPYWFGCTDSWYMRYAPHKLKVVLNIAYEQWLQRMTYRKGKLWVCPAAMETRDPKFQTRLQQLYLQGFHM